MGNSWEKSCYKKTIIINKKDVYLQKETRRKEKEGNKTRRKQE